MEDFTEKAALCAMNRIFGFEPRIAHALVMHIGSATDIFRGGRKDAEEALGPYSKYKGQITDKALEDSMKELEFLAGKGTIFTGFTEEEYPSLLKECEDAPVGLYIRSDTPAKELFTTGTCISVIGTRDLSPYGKDWCRRIVLSLRSAGQKPVIISGLALGTDICAHAAALEAGLPTIGVMATGPDAVYPLRHREFAERMVHTRGCALVTDYPPGTAPLAVHFLRRNRIIAGLSEATVLIESKIKGGGMMTSRLAFSYNRDVYALPGRADDICSQGCNMLIREKIAEPVTDIGNLLKSLGVGPVNKTGRIPDKEMLSRMYGSGMSEDRIGEMARLLIGIRKERGITVEELAASTGMDFGKVSALVRILESDGIVSVDILQRCTINVRKSELFV